MMNENKSKKFDLEERLIDFAVLIIEISESLNNTRAGNHISGQLVRSGTSPALHYGEAQSAESRNDFVHKLKILLKELRETLVALKIIKRVSLTKKIDLVEKGIIECNELISIFVKSIETAKRNNPKSK
ncbi:MAG: four helix bundle protein [Ignavibacteriaceae bacterium]